MRQAPAAPQLELVQVSKAELKTLLRDAYLEALDQRATLERHLATKELCASLGFSRRTWERMVVGDEELQGLAIRGHQGGGHPRWPYWAVVLLLRRRGYLEDL